MRGICHRTPATTSANTPAATRDARTMLCSFDGAFYRRWRPDATTRHACRPGDATLRSTHRLPGERGIASPGCAEGGPQRELLIRRRLTGDRDARRLTRRP